jgi:ribosomal protein S18 acetylase RimI-like enzyme
LIFRITSATPDPALDHQLHTRGFDRIDETCVMSMPMHASRPAASHPTLRYEDADPGRFARITGELRAYAPDHVAEHCQRLAAIAVPCTRMLACDDQGRHAAAGIVVVDGELAGIFDVVVDERVRRRGYARALMDRLLDAGRAAGARTAYLQVEYSNTAARQLYASLGFTDRYTYWYRTQQHN